ncbi:DUF4145 domain-containing protein [Paucilactobacillus sp. N302-9]
METKLVNFTEGRYTALQAVQIEIPILCPYCGVSNNPVNHLQGNQSYSDGYCAFFSHTCTSCNVNFFSIQWFKKSEKGFSKEAVARAIAPNTTTQKFSSYMNKFSPRFVDSYNQAYSAEQNGLLDLAGMGYRAAEEILIKDFALKIIEDGSDEKKQYIADLSLNNVIGHYFKDDPTLMVPTDVVRINGNDYAHWDRPDNFDVSEHLEAQKAYLKIFISIVETRLLILNPPVSRNKD